MTKKGVVFTALTVLLSTASLGLWICWDTFFRNLGNPTLLLLSISFLLLFLALTCLLSFLADSAKVVLPAFALCSLSVFPATPASALTLVISLILFLTLIFFSFRIRKEKELHLKLSLSHIASRHLGLLFTIIAASLSLIYYTTAAAKPFEFRLTIPEDIFNLAAQGALSALSTQLQSSKQPWQERELAEELFEREVPELRRALEKQGITDPDELEMAIEEARRTFLEQYEEEAKETLQTPTARDQKILAHLRQTVETTLNRIISPYRRFIPVALAASFFLTFEFFGFLIKTFTIVFAKLLFKILCLTNVVKIETEPREAEKITI